MNASGQIPDARTAFILMPFEEPFNTIYTSLVSPALVEAGYVVKRADSVLDQQNVLRDIVTGIDSADLIVADLTDLNPNVFYELGIAHGLGIPTILLTQAIDDIPFDLRAYRVKEYSDRFDKATDLQESLTAIATEHTNGDVTFGSPVSDFLPNGHAARRLKKRETTSASAETGTPNTAPKGDSKPGSHSDDGEEDSEASSEEDKGLLDLLTDVLAAGEAIGVIGETISEETTSITEKLTFHGQNIEKAGAAGSGSVSAAQIVARALAADLESYAQALKPPIQEMADVAQVFSDSSLVWLSRIEPIANNRQELKDYDQQLVELKATLTQTREGMIGFREAIVSIKGWSSRVDRANRQVVAQVDALINSLDYLLAFTSRGREIVDEKLAGDSE